MSDSSIWSAIGFMLLLAILGVALGQSATTAATPTHITNESLTVDYTQPVGVNAGADAGYLDNETLTNSTNNVLVEGTDYDWNTQNGTVTFYDTNNTTSGSTAEIDYTARQHDDTTSLVDSVLGVLAGLFPYFMLAIVGLGVASLLGVI